MPLFGNREKPSFSPRPTPTSPSPSLGGMIKESLFGSRPTPKPEQKPQAKPESGKLFGVEGYTKYGSMREFTKKLPYQKITLPGTWERITREKGLKAVEDLKKVGERIGLRGGVTEEAYRNRILPHVKKELHQIYEKTHSTESKEYKDLVKKVQTWEQVIRGGSK